VEETPIAADAAKARMRIIAWALVTAAATAVFYLYVDLPAAKAFEPYHHRVPQPLYAFLIGLRQYGQGPFALATVVLMVIYDRRRKREIVTLVIAIVVMAAAVNLLKILTGRVRPDNFLSGSPEWKALGGIMNRDYRSFPSAHAASAFAYSVVMSTIYRKWRWAFMTLAAMCAASRVVDIQHWASDVTVGAALGAWIGYGAFNWRWARALAARLAPSSGAEGGASGV
jgi:membrane-associated phospholipid phosphatase